MRHVPGSVIRTVLFASLAALVGCGTGSASVTDSISNTSMQLNTVYGLIQTVSGVDAKGNYMAASTRSLDIVASGATFDATKDLRFDSAADQFQDAEDNQKNGWIVCHVTDVTKIITGTPYDFSAVGDGCYVGFGDVQLTDATSLPGPFITGTKINYTMTFTELGSSVGGSFSSTFTYTVAAGPLDPADVETGTLTVKLSGPLVNELLGECNGVDLGLSSTALVTAASCAG